jgi:hypothetical protein
MSITELFGEPIYAYTRKQAVEDGEQVEIPMETCREAGFKFPIYLTRTVWNIYVEVPPGVIGQDKSGRLADVLWMLRCQIREGQTNFFSLHVRNDNRDRTPPLVTLKAVCGPKDMDDPEPTITIMLTTED